jgi:hypothetical protein
MAKQHATADLQLHHPGGTMSIGITSALSATAVAEESVAALGGLELAGVIDWRMRKEPNAWPKPRGPGGRATRHGDDAWLRLPDSLPYPHCSGVTSASHSGSPGPG